MSEFRNPTIVTHALRPAALLLLAVTLSPRCGAQSEGVLDYRDSIRPLLAERCFRCHGEEKQKGGFRLDRLDPDLVEGGDAEDWDYVLDMIHGAEMPPEDEPQFTDEERRAVVGWLEVELARAAAARREEPVAVIRRLTRAQYTNTLQELLGVPVDYGRLLPADAKSKTGFTNAGASLGASQLHIETWEALARQAVADAIGPAERPAAKRYRVVFGRGIGKGHVAARTGGYQSVPLSTDDFRIDVLDAEGGVVEPNDPEERARLDALRRHISVGFRGSQQDRFQVVDEGLMLFSAVPHREVAPTSWQGPSPNMKLEMQRVFPDHGNLALRVRASRGYVPPLQKALLLALDEPVARTTLDDELHPVVEADARVFAAERADQLRNQELVDGVLQPLDVPKDSQARFVVEFPADGFYQFDLVHPPRPADANPTVRLKVDGMTLDNRPAPGDPATEPARRVTPLGAAGLLAGRHQVLLGGPFFVGFSELVVTPLGADHPLVARLLAQAEQRTRALDAMAPAIRAFVGTRTDDGMDYATFDTSRVVTAPLGAAEVFEFHGRLEDLPVPEPESGDDEILSGFTLIGLWNDHLVKSRAETGPPLLVEWIEVEAPFEPQWPPASYQRIFSAADPDADLTSRTRQVLERFLPRAFRRPVAHEEIGRYVDFWEQIRGSFARWEDGVGEVLVAALCSPNLLFLAEPGIHGDAVGGGLGDHALATRLSYFLWNGPPDSRLRGLADDGVLGEHLLTEVDRLLDDPRSARFIEAFGHDWLRLDRLEQVSIHPGKHPDFTRFVKRDMRRETLLFLERVFRDDLPLTALVDSDFAMLNQNLAEFYGIEGVVGQDFRVVALDAEQRRRRGGILTHGAFLAGHSDGTWPHPIKRAVWLKEKILGEKPPAPPPNVPDLDPETPGFEKLTLKEQLEVHRNKASCRDCHKKIDPYGVVFERFSAVGRFEGERRGLAVDASSVLPDGTELDGVDELKAWLLAERRDAMARAFIEHLMAYALGRDLGFQDSDRVDAILRDARIAGYRARAIVRSLVTSEAFVGR